MKTCFLFPGQGAQKPGMARDLWEHSPAVKQLFEQVSHITGLDARRLLFEGSEEELKTTSNTQLAMTLGNVAAAMVLSEHGVDPDAVAGFSVGEYAALHAAGVITTENLFNAVQARGRFMEEASRQLDGAGAAAGMAAVVGRLHSPIAGLLEAAGEGVHLAIQSTRSQITLAGTAEGLDRAEEVFKKGGARRFIRLQVSGPFHSPLIDAARQRFSETLAKLEFKAPRLPVYANVIAAVVKTGDEAKELCLKQIVSTVRWADEVSQLIADGYQHFLEVGTGSVLTGMFRDFDDTVGCLPAGTLAHIQSVARGAES